MTTLKKYSYLSLFLAIVGDNVFADTGLGQQGRTFYRHFFIDGGPIVWVVLLPMSVIAVYLALDLLINTRRNRLLPAGIASEIATHAVRYGFTALMTKLTGRVDLISRSILRALEQGRQLGGSPGAIRQFAAEALQERGMQLMRKAQWCQIIGSVAPMVGLFGTVYGMIRAFNLLGQGTGGPRYELLAEAISMALVTTFWGLLVGIPALFLYGFFQMRVEALISEAAVETEAVLGRILKNGDMPLLTGVESQESKEPKPQPKGTFLRRKQKRLHNQPLKPRPIKRKQDVQTVNTQSPQQTAE